MDYNKSADTLNLKEFGRNIQNMVAYVKSIEDRTKRTGLAQEMVRIMACLKPAQKETAENRDKLWDQLYHIANYDLDIDCPVPVPVRRPVEPSEEERMPYSQRPPKFKQYGRMVEKMLEEAYLIEDAEEQKALVTMTANYMKNLIKGNDKDTIVEATVRAHLSSITKGRLLFDLETMVFSKIQPQGPKSNNVPVRPQKTGFGQKKQFGNFNRPQSGGTHPGKKRFGNGGSNSGNGGNSGNRPAGGGGGYSGGANAANNRPRRPRIN
jgi:uncharacterized membrane protein YgcG